MVIWHCVQLWLDRSIIYAKVAIFYVLSSPTGSAILILDLRLLLLRRPVEQLNSPVFHPPHISLEIMQPKPVESRIEVLQRVFNTQVFAGLWASQVVHVSALSGCKDLFLRSWTSDLIVGAESCFDRLCAMGTWCVQVTGGQGCVYFSERVGQDQSVLEGLAGAGALVGAACVGDVAEEAD